MKRLLFLFFMGLFLTYSQVMLAIYGGGNYSDVGDSCAGILRDYYNTDLFEACANGDLSRAQQIIKIGWANVNTLNTSGKTLLHVAVFKGHREIVKLLIENGAYLIKDRSGLTPLDYAVSLGLQDVAELLRNKENKVPGAF